MARNSRGFSRVFREKRGFNNEKRGFYSEKREFYDENPIAQRTMSTTFERVYIYPTVRTSAAVRYESGTG